jgi:predicted CoA-binding protein
MLEEMMLDRKVWAVVGANENPEKYGNMIYRKLRAKGYEVYPVNPNYETVEGDKCYKDLSSLPKARCNRHGSFAQARNSGNKRGC